MFGILMISYLLIFIYFYSFKPFSCIPSIIWL